LVLHLSEHELHERVFAELVVADGSHLLHRIDPVRIGDFVQDVADRLVPVSFLEILSAGEVRLLGLRARRLLRRRESLR